MVGASLIEDFESYMGADWTPDMRAGTDADQAIALMMLEAAEVF